MAAMATTTPFGPLDFQLVLLRRMADFHPGLVEDARRELGASAARMREANRRWQAMAHASGGRSPLGRYRAALGEPEHRERRRTGDLEYEALRWPVPLWPDLRFEVLSATRGGGVWNAWLIRAPGAPGPGLRTAADLTPWSCTVDEAARAFPPATPMQGSAPTRSQLALTLPEGGGRAVAEFTWGLFQRLV
ncbi:Hypothetical protein SCLAV_1637 [Streptomyces clavuligerus]|uniref:Uncharacterized protein n=2 Tax=Streptomyces clavuligerus TaxID=1901 RepID=E2Q2V9_STRCL|nr:Hypothetical protein SCLAV_1637 [Streptomyces clavuligerus]